jgi:hypothetical protein
MCQLWLRLGADFVGLRYGEVRRILLKRTSQNPQNAKFAESPECELRRIPIPRTLVNRARSRAEAAKSSGPPPVQVRSMVAFCGRLDAHSR